MTMFKEGDNPQPGTPAVDVRAYTLGVRLASGKVTPCTEQGQRAEFAFGDTVKAVENGFGVALHSKTHSGGIGVPVLAGDVIELGEECIVGMVNFTIDGAVESLPVLLPASAGAAGDFIIGKASLGSSSLAKDADINRPSIAFEFYDHPMPIVGGDDQADTILSFPINLASVGNGDVVTDFTPGFAGEIVSWKFVVTVPATTAAKTMALNLEINAIDVTGGVLTITSANATPIGNVVAATAITAANTFDANDTISIEASAVTAFVEGAGVLTIRLRVAA